MRRALALLAAALFAAGVLSCGGAGLGANSSTREPETTTNLTRADSDKDNDTTATRPYDSKDNGAVLGLGHPASASDRQAIVALLDHYYGAALAENGAAACSMIYSTLAESIPEDYGSSYSGAPAYMRGATCPVVMAKYFEHFHSLLALELPKLKVTRVRLQEHHGLAVLSFGTLPERQILVAREGHVWRVTDLLDSELP